MREIKFRAWSGKSMEHGGFYIHATGKIITTPLTRVTEESPLMQFTGLTDKNGKDIYEGDIMHSSDEGEQDGVVFFSENGKWVMKFKKGGREDLCDFAMDDTIIGNIHQSPELLKD